MERWPSWCLLEKSVLDLFLWSWPAARPLAMVGNGLAMLYLFLWSWPAARPPHVQPWLAMGRGSAQPNTIWRAMANTVQQGSCILKLLVPNPMGSQCWPRGLAHWSGQVKTVGQPGRRMARRPSSDETCSSTPHGQPWLAEGLGHGSRQHNSIGQPRPTLASRPVVL